MTATPAAAPAAAPAATPAAAPSPAALLADTERLVQVLEAENRALAAHDEAAVRALLSEKQAACAAFEDVMRRLADAGAKPVGSTPARLQLATLGERLRRASAENQRRLTAGIAARKRFLDMIAEAVRSQDGGAGTYARSGAPARPRGTTIAPSALSFDRAL